MSQVIITNWTSFIHIPGKKNAKTKHLDLVDFLELIGRTPRIKVVVEREAEIEVTQLLISFGYRGEMKLCSPKEYTVHDGDEIIIYKQRTKTFCMYVVRGDEAMSS